MKMRLFAALIAILFICSGLFADEMKAGKDKAMEEAMMKAWQEFATPGEPHKAMMNLVGTWNTVVKSYMDPANPAETKGTSTFTSILDGRFLQETAEGTFNGMPFHGMGTFGYDNMQKKYVSTWVDNFGTGIMNSTGTSDDGGKTITWNGTSSDPMTGKVQSYRSVMHMMGQNEYHFEMFGPGPDGKETKMMEISYARKM